MNPLQTPILAARGVVKTYRTGLHEVRALRGVDLDVHHGSRRWGSPGTAARSCRRARSPI